MTPHDSTRCAVCGYVAIPPVCTKCATPTPSAGVGAVDATEQEAFEILHHALYVAKGEGFVEQFDTLGVLSGSIAALREQVATLTAQYKGLRDAVNATACVDGCDSVAHAEGCTTTDLAFHLSQMQAALVALRATPTVADVMAVIDAMVSEGFDDCSGGYALKVARERLAALAAAEQGGRNG